MGGHQRRRITDNVDVLRLREAAVLLRDRLKQLLLETGGAD
ncbi:MAG: hypothetical protein R3D55_02530 [Chloroflexota bacterium]